MYYCWFHHRGENKGVVAFFSVGLQYSSSIFLMLWGTKMSYNLILYFFNFLLYLFGKFYNCVSIIHLQWVPERLKYEDLAQFILVK